MKGIQISLESIRFVGKGLHRPECVLCLHDGTILIPDWNGGVTKMVLGHRIEAVHSSVPEDRLKPNGIALLQGGTLLLSNLAEDGGVWKLAPGSIARPFIQVVDGVDVPPCNFVLVDHKSRIWITVSTHCRPRSLGYRPGTDDGFVILVDAKGARIVADGLGYTNEVRLDPKGDHLYVVETFGRKISRFKISPDGDLSRKEVFTTFGYGTFPDGLAFDCENHLWVTSVISNRVIRIAPDGSQQIILEDNDPEEVEIVEIAFLAGKMDDSHMESNSGKRLQSISSIAFGGADLTTVYLGCIHGEQIAFFQFPIAGLPMAHWTWKC